jgi:competence protein ComEA
MKKILSILMLVFLIASVGVYAKDAKDAKKDTKSSTAAESKASAAPAAKADAEKTTLIDINSATKDQLKSLSGIGDAYADKIIAGRPYSKKDQLVSKNVLPQGVYDKVADKIVAKQK